MRINQLIASRSGLSRRAADTAITAGQVNVNGQTATLGQSVTESDTVTLNGKPLVEAEKIYLLLNKPPGYVTSRRKQQDLPTIYELLPKKYHHLKPAGRLDADSCGLLLLTNDGALILKLTHPSHQKIKRYVVTLDKPLTGADRQKLGQGVTLSDGPSKLRVIGEGKKVSVELSQGRNRQIRRSFGALKYRVDSLERIAIAGLTSNLKPGQYQELKTTELP